jgi:dTMP kinase
MNKASKNTILVREPGGSTISERIREILLDKNLQEMSERTEALLMTASRSQLTYEKIIKNLKHGKNVISDRFSDSTLAYQGGGRELDIDWLIKLNKFATFDIKPDITFLIDLHPEEALKRKNIQQDRIENAGIEFQLKVRNMYLHVSKLFQDRIVIIDGHEKASVINKKILDELFRRNIINEDII